MLSINLLSLLVFVASLTTSFAQIEVQHCKPTTVTKTVSRTRTVVRTMTPKATPLATSSARIKTVTKTVSTIGAPVTERLVGMSMFVGENSGCDPITGRVRNDSAIGWNVLVSRGDLKAGSCNNVYWSVQPSNALEQATLSIECKGKAAFLQVHSYGRWVPKCDKSTLVSGIVFPNGYNCTARGQSYQPPFELALTTDVCSNRPLPGPSKQATGTTLQFASVFNIYMAYGRGIGGNFTNLDTAEPISRFLTNGVQVMVLTPTGSLDTAASKPVSLSLVEQAGSPGIAWNRAPKLEGTLVSTPMVGVASFGELGITTVGNYRIRACIEGNICTNSATLQIIPEDITRTVILRQPGKDTEISLFNPLTSQADFTTATGPLNVTFSDDLGNNGAQAVLLGPGLVEANVTCQVATEASPDSPQFNVESAKFVNSVRAVWTPTGYAEFWSLGKVREGIDAAFGPGTVAGALQGFRCWTEIHLAQEIRSSVNETLVSATSNFWLLK